ncbi:MAG: DUF1499 domain-containing protein [Erythrobacter sp.]|uniref:DUF1499 domain-containing protein n=1 Tax=Erythrobacter sp. TaxID=1042 RepID=UPI00262EF065|nr:DUF1499 domain-containing protein [Erythrobacter sp.]MDJ0979626.1 DUF1499 domain-containing protein [Erythrobacter sp.]
MKKKAPWHAGLARSLAIILPVFLAVCALGTKFGLWDWQLGLSAFGLGGLILIALTALIATVSIVLIVRRDQKSGLGPAIFGLVVSLGFAALFAPVIMGAGDHPIHDMATDTSDPPSFSARVLAARKASGANPLNAYDVPMSETEQFGETKPPHSQLTYADIIAQNYPELEPLAIGDTQTGNAMAALEGAMKGMGFTNIIADPETGTVEGLAETFWFGFKDDVVARVADGEIDFRSVSRVGQSDLGANAKRIMELRQRTAQKLGR